MARIEGRITIVQESRFQLVDDAGVGHLMILDALSGAEPDQLVELVHRQARVVVHSKPGHGVIGNIAIDISTV